MSRASGDRPRVKFDGIADFEFALPPLNEQRRIVEKIDALFARLDKGEEALRAVQRQLRTYRQSVLKAAVTGELTRDWREAHKDQLEPASELLERILQTRREQWRGRGKYKEAVEPLIFGLGEIPEAWIWVSIDQVLREGPSNGRSVRTAETGFPVLRLTALKDGKIDVEERKIGAWTEEKARPHCIEYGDVLVSRGNGSKNLVGRGGLVAGEPGPIAFPDTMIRIPIQPRIVDPEWFLHMWNSYFLRRQIEENARTTAGIYKINQTAIRSFVVPLPPLAEQEEIVRRIDQSVDRALAGESACQSELKRSSSLRQSILRHAVSGQLVPQNSSDESASSLLERIRSNNPVDKPARKKKKIKA